MLPRLRLRGLPSARRGWQHGLRLGNLATPRAASFAGYAATLRFYVAIGARRRGGWELAVALLRALEVRAVGRDAVSRNATIAERIQ
jgi:hypothetical protein